MATVNDVVTRAYRLLQVVDAESEMSAHEGETGLATINEMMARWKQDGISVGWKEAASLADVMVVPPEARRAMAYNLAVALAPEFGIVKPDVIVEAEREYAAVLRDSQNVEPSNLDHLPGLRGRFDINSGY